MNAGIGWLAANPTTVAPCLTRGLAFLVADFAKTRLVYVERHDTIEGAIAREKLVKKWRREWKFALIEAYNPGWEDLWEQWFAPETEQT
jgi:hypothetical protein